MSSHSFWLTQLPELTKQHRYQTAQTQGHPQAQGLTALSTEHQQHSLGQLASALCVYEIGTMITVLTV